MTTTEIERTAVLIAKCPKCKTVTKIERPYYPNSSALVGGHWIDCAQCGRWLNDTKTAKFSSTKCGAKCRNAVGPSCSCECGGRNHAEGMRD